MSQDQPSFIGNRYSKLWLYGTYFN